MYSLGWKPSVCPPYSGTNVHHPIKAIEEEEVAIQVSASSEKCFSPHVKKCSQIKNCRGEVKKISAVLHMPLFNWASRELSLWKVLYSTAGCLSVQRSAWSAPLRQRIHCVFVWWRKLVKTLKIKTKAHVNVAYIRKLSKVVSELFFWCPLTFILA